MFLVYWFFIKNTRIRIYKIVCFSLNSLDHFFQPLCTGCAPGAHRVPLVFTTGPPSLLGVSLSQPPRRVSKGQLNGPFERGITVFWHGLKNHLKWIWRLHKTPVNKIDINGFGVWGSGCFFFLNLRLKIQSIWWFEAEIWSRSCCVWLSKKNSGFYHWDGQDGFQSPPLGFSAGCDSLLDAQLNRDGRPSGFARVMFQSEEVTWGSWTSKQNIVCRFWVQLMQLNWVFILIILF